MFLIERLFGVATYSVCLLICCFLIVKTKIKYKKILFLYTIALAFMGFFYVPYVTADLYRIYEYAEFYASLNFTKFFENYVLNSDRPMANIYYRIIAQTGVLGLIPAFSVIVTYSCVFYIMFRSSEKFNATRRQFAIVLFFTMSIGNYMYVIAGIRSMMAVSMVAFCFFRENFEKKFNVFHIFLYIVAALFHNLAVVLIAIRLLFFILEGGISVKKLFILLFLGVVVLILKDAIAVVIENTIDKAEGYVNGDEYSYVWEYIIAAVAIFAMLTTVFMNGFNNKKFANNQQTRSSAIFVLICIFIATCFCYEFSIFHRITTYFVPIVFMPILFAVLKKKQNTYFSYFIIITSTLLLALACSRGTLCSLKFFVL